VSFDGLASSSPPANDGGIEHWGGGARPSVVRTLNLAYGAPNSNSTLPTQSRQQGDSDLLTYVTENGPRVAGDDSATRLTSGDGEGAL
jgi:hypothetical protein